MKAKISLMIFALMITLSGCNTSEGDIYQRINQKYLEPDSYSAKCTATVTGNKTENTYEFEVIFKSPDYTKMIFSPNDVEIVIDGNKLSMENKLINHTIHLNGEGGEYPNFIINTFFKNYFAGENSSADVSSFPNGNHTVLECELPNGNDYACTQKLIIDNKTLYPVRLMTLDKKGDTVIDVTFTDFSFE